MNSEQVALRLKIAQVKSGLNVSDFAVNTLHISQSNLSQILNGGTPPNKQSLDYLNMKKVKQTKIIYVKK